MGLFSRNQSKAQETWEAKFLLLTQEIQRLRDMVSRGRWRLSDAGGCLSACPSPWLPSAPLGRTPRQRAPPSFTPASPQLADRAGEGSSKAGFLLKHRLHGKNTLWARAGERRYFILQGDTLRYYRSERDVQYAPRGQFSVRGTFVLAEGLKGRKFWTLSVVDAAGNALIRMSTESQANCAAWVDALEGAGCVRRTVDESSDTRSDSSRERGRSPDSSRAASPAASSAGASAPSGSDATPTHSGASPADSGASGAPQGGASLHGVGHTSDQSDVVLGQAAAGAPSDGGRGGTPRGVRREPMPPSALIHREIKHSKLPSEPASVMNQRGGPSAVSCCASRPPLDSACL
jgi:hypothetical protein